MKVDYSKGKIYKITNDFNDDIYVGSTCDTLVKRFSGHKTDINNDKKKNRPLYTLMNEIGFNRFRIQLICDYPCEDKYQLRQKEGEYIRLLGTLNKNVAGRIGKEYYNENKDKIIASWKSYYENNKDKKLEYNKEYYLQNKDEVISKNKQYYQKQRHIILEIHKKTITCGCGCIINAAHKLRHEKTNKHAKLMNELQST